MANETSVKTHGPSLRVGGRVRHVDPPSDRPTREVEQKAERDLRRNRRGRSRISTLRVPRARPVSKSPDVDVRESESRAVADIGASLRLGDDYAQNHTAAEMLHIIESVSDVVQLDEIQRSEESRSNPRKTVLRAIEDKRQELAGDQQ